MRILLKKNCSPIWTVWVNPTIYYDEPAYLNGLKINFNIDPEQINQFYTREEGKPS